MNALDIMKALHDVPDDLIDECMDEPAAIINVQSEPADIFADAGQMTAAEPVRKYVDKPMLTRILPGITVAACLLFAAGTVVWLLYGSSPSMSVRNSPSDTAEVTVIEATDTTPLPMTGITTTETLPVPTAPVYAELELYPNEKHVYSNTELHDEIDRLMEEGKKRFEQNGAQPALIDTESYVSRYFSADSAENRNSPEAKSYLFHMMLNSMDYFRTAEGEMIYEMFSGSSYPYKIEFQVNQTARSSYERQSRPNTTLHNRELYYADDIQYAADTESQTYFISYYTKQQDFLLSDYERIITQQDGSTLGIIRPVAADMNALCNNVLTPQVYAMSALGDFDTWQVTGITTILGRTCAVIECSQQNRQINMLTDVNCGFLLKYESYDKESKRDGYWEATALTIDGEIDVKRFDPAGYTCMNPENITSAAPALNEQTQHVTGDYSINENGQTYGKTPMDAVFISDYPDLIAVIGDNGNEGYIFKEDYIGEFADSPAEANRITEAQRNGSYTPRTIYVYESDRKTVIDTFTEGNRITN